MKVTLRYAREFLGEYIDDGSCDEETVDKRINEIVQLLLEGDYDAIDRYCMRICGNCVTLPPDVEAVRKANIDGCNAKVWTQWFEFLSGDGGSGCNWNCDAIIHRGKEFVTFTDLEQPMYLLALSDHEEDKDAKVFVAGINHNGEPARSTVDGVRRYGEEISISELCKPHYTSNVYSSVTLFQKPLTKGIVRLYGFLPECEATAQGLETNLFMIGYYLPWETNPSYTRVEFGGVPINGGSQATVLVKRKWVPLVHPDQILPVSNLQAMIDMALSITARNNSEPGERREFQRQAKDRMEAELENTRNDEQEVDVELFTPEIVV